MALISFWYDVHVYDPYTPVWRKDDDRCLWRLYLGFDTQKEKDEMIEWCNNTFGYTTSKQDWKYVDHSNISLIISIHSLDLYTLFNMSWM